MDIQPAALGSATDAASVCTNSFSIFYYHTSEGLFKRVGCVCYKPIIITKFLHHSCSELSEYNTQTQKCQGSQSSVRPRSGDVLHFNRPLFSLMLLQHATPRAKVAMEMDFNARTVRAGSNLFLSLDLKSGSSRESKYDS